MKWLRKVMAIAYWVGQSQLTLAQLAPQLFIGHKAAEYNFLWYEDVDKNGKVSLFNFTSFKADYARKANNAYEIYQVGIYNLNKSWGIAGGGRFIGGEFVPLVALSFQKASKDFYLNVFPSAQYSPSLGRIEYSLFGLVFYRPQLNNRWRMFNQVAFEPLLHGKKHMYSYQQIRIGLEYKQLVQFGIGANFEQVGERFRFSQNYGLFVRKEFNF